MTAPAVQIPIATAGLMQISAPTPAFGPASPPAAYSVGSIQIQMVAQIETLFSLLAEKWREETEFLSSGTEIVAHPAYKRIIQLGWPVVPLLLREMAVAPYHWATALTAITGSQPVGEEDAGRLDRIAKAWVRWGQEHGYEVTRLSP
jgi:hypothetical protein